MANSTTVPGAVSLAEFEAELTKMVEGILKNVPAGVSLGVEGTMAGPAAMVALLQPWLDRSRKVREKEQELKAALNARIEITVETRKQYKTIKAALKAFFGPESALLASFGIAADKPRVRTAKAELVAAAKRQQTREVRGTKGPKERLKLKVVGEPTVAIMPDGKLNVGAPSIHAGNATPPAGAASPVNLAPGASGVTPNSVAAPVGGDTPVKAGPAGGGTSGTPSGA